MDPLTSLIDRRGFFTRAEALECGSTDAELAAARRAGAVTRICQGYYTATSTWSALGEVDRHLLRGRAAVHQMPGAVVLSHTTGALAHGLDVWGLPLDLVHVTRLDRGAGRRANGVVHHRGQVAEGDPRLVGDHLVLPPARCALEAATLGGGEQALVLLDSLLHHSLATDEDLVDQFAAMTHWPATLKLHMVVRMADRRSGSVGESRLRWLLRCGGIPAPRLQHEVRDALGTLLGTCDMAWPELGVVLEFDGRAKYEKHLAAGMTPGDAVFAEKQREDRIREATGFVVIRVVWADLQRPRVLLDRIRRALAQQAGRSTTVA